MTIITLRKTIIFPLLIFVFTLVALSFTLVLPSAAAQKPASPIEFVTPMASIMNQNGLLNGAANFRANLFTPNVPSTTNEKILFQVNNRNNYTINPDGTSPTVVGSGSRKREKIYSLLWSN